MKRYGAICPHSGGLFTEEFECDAETLQEAHATFWRMCVGSRYVRRIFELGPGGWVQVWQEGESLAALATPGEAE